MVAMCKPQKDHVNSPTNTLVPRIVSGSIGSVITALAVTPLEVVKIRQQASLPSDTVSSPDKFNEKIQAKSLHRGRGTVMLRNGLRLPKTSCPCLVAPGHTDSMSRPALHTNLCPKFYESTLCTGTSAGLELPTSSGSSTFKMLRSILRNEGIAGLYTGLRPTLLMTVPNTALTLTIYDELMSVSLINHLDTRGFAPLFVGAFSRCVSSTVTLPFELIRTRQASFMSRHGVKIGQVPDLTEDIRYLLQNYGVFGLYKGLPITLVRDSSFSGIYFLCLEWFRSNLNELIHAGKVNDDSRRDIPKGVAVAHNLISGAGAAAIATLLTGPLDTAKTRKQMVHNEGASYVHSNRNMLRLIHSIYKFEGIAGLWKGNKARMTKVVPASAIMIACYEMGKDIIRDVFC